MDANPSKWIFSIIFGILLTFRIYLCLCSWTKWKLTFRRLRLRRILLFFAAKRKFYSRKVLLVFCHLNSWVRIKSSLLFWCALGCFRPKAILKILFDELKRIESSNWTQRHRTPSIRPQKPMRFSYTDRGHSTKNIFFFMSLAQYYLFFISTFRVRVYGWVQWSRLAGVRVDVDVICALSSPLPFSFLVLLNIFYSAFECQMFTRIKHTLALPKHTHRPLCVLSVRSRRKRKQTT